MIENKEFGTNGISKGTMLEVLAKGNGLNDMIVSPEDGNCGVNACANCGNMTNNLGEHKKNYWSWYKSPDFTPL